MRAEIVPHYYLYSSINVEVPTSSSSHLRLHRPIPGQVVFTFVIVGVPGDSHANVTVALHGRKVAVKRETQQKAGQRARATIANKNTVQTWTEHSG